MKNIDLTSKNKLQTMHNPKLFELACAAIDDGIKLVCKMESEKTYIPIYYNFPSMHFFDSGFPSFTEGIYAGKTPKNFGDLLAPRNGSPDHRPQSWTIFKEYALSDHHFIKYFSLQDEDQNNSDISITTQMLNWSREYFTRYQLGHLLDRYLNTTNIREFDIDLFAPIYKTWEFAIYEKELIFDIYIPIVCQHFDFDEVILSNDVRVVRMDTELQLARSTVNYYKVTPNKSVAGAATHALVLNKWHVKNDSYNKHRDLFYDIHTFSRVIDKVDRFFAALRAETKVSTGYCQIVSIPIGWADDWIANLPFIYAVATRAYPEIFDDFGWLRNTTPISADKTKAVGHIFDALEKSNHASLHIAERRLNMAFLRSEEADTIIDITIGLEALLVGDSSNEISHKLALRLASLTKIENDITHTAKEIFRLVKQIYTYRSAVVHGTKTAEKKRLIMVHKTESIPAVEVGIYLLSYALRTLAINPKYLDPNELDSLLLSN